MPLEVGPKHWNQAVATFPKKIRHSDAVYYFNRIPGFPGIDISRWFFKLWPHIVTSLEWWWMYGGIIPKWPPGQTPSLARTGKDHHARNVMMMNKQDTPQNPPNLNGNDSIFQGSWGRIWHVMMRDNQDTPQRPQPNDMYLSRVTKKMIIL